jgi:hypothetical protein
MARQSELNFFVIFNLRKSRRKAIFAPKMIKLFTKNIVTKSAKPINTGRFAGKGGTGQIGNSSKGG